jgi:beta-phosphoglucomutase-like phosphatase (HAD superfamily)
MTSPPAPYAALDGVLSQVRHLLLDFDGPVCTLYTRKPEPPVADQLRTILAASGTEIPRAVAESADPFAVLAYSATCGTQLARRAEAELTRQELIAVKTARPAGYSHDLISSAREGRRTVTVISTHSAHAVRGYLDRVTLTDLVALVIGRRGYITDPAAEQDTISRALAGLPADPSACAVLTASPDLIKTASARGVRTIAYAHVPGADESASPHAQATVTTLADLVLRLRAHPLPN